MEAGELGVFRSHLIERRDRIEAVRGSEGESPDLARLLGEVDAALERVEHRTFGICGRDRSIRQASWCKLHPAWRAGEQAQT